MPPSAPLTPAHRRALQIESKVIYADLRVNAVSFANLTVCGVGDTCTSWQQDDCLQCWFRARFAYATPVLTLIAYAGLCILRLD